MKVESSVFIVQLTAKPKKTIDDNSITQSKFNEDGAYKSPSKLNIFTPFGILDRDMTSETDINSRSYYNNNSMDYGVIQVRQKKDKIANESYYNSPNKNSRFNKHYRKLMHEAISEKQKESYYRKSGFYSSSPQLTRTKTNKHKYWLHISL